MSRLYEEFRDEAFIRHKIIKSCFEFIRKAYDPSYDLIDLAVQFRLRSKEIGEHLEEEPFFHNAVRQAIKSQEESYEFYDGNLIRPIRISLDDDIPM